MTREIADNVREFEKQLDRLPPALRREAKRQIDEFVRRAMLERKCPLCGHLAATFDSGACSVLEFAWPPEDRGATWFCGCVGPSHARLAIKASRRR